MRLSNAASYFALFGERHQKCGSADLQMVFSSGLNCHL